MSVPDVLNQPWAITREKFAVICDVYDRHLAGERLDAAGIKAAIGADTRKSEQSDPYTIQDGVAVIPIDGVMAKKMNLFTAISGGTSTQMLTDAVNAAIADPAVHSIMLVIDSPGGEVDGTQQLGDAVAASPKPTAAFIDGQGCSAAMWIAAQCDSIWAASDTSEVGSIAVVMTHVDRSKANEARGIKPTHITTGKYKRILTSDAPLSQDGLAYGQDKVDYLHTLFVNAVADGRGISPEIVDSTMADGQTFYAQQAVDIGLIDGIASEDEVIAKLVSSATATQSSTSGANMSQPFRAFATEADFSAAMSAEFERGKASATVTTATVEAARSEALAAGAKSERERITAIEALPLAKVHAAVVAQCKAEGKSPADATLAILAAEGAAQAKASSDRASEIQPPVNASAADATKEAADRAAAAASAPKDDGPSVAQIQAHVRKCKAEGRTVSTLEALAELESTAK